MRPSRVGGLLTVLALVVALKIGHDLWRWWAYAEERAELRSLTARLEEVGVEVVRTQLAADSLRHGILRSDSALNLARDRVDAYESWTEGGVLPGELYARYRGELASFNRQVAERNERLTRWEEVVVRNHTVVARYNELADSIRLVAARIGEPYYPVPTPVELAERRGIRLPTVSPAPGAAAEPPS